MAALARRKIPLVIASSKTRAEILAWRSRLGNHDPFISENGGALYLPPGPAARALPLARRSGRYLQVRFGATYPRLRGCLRLISRQLGVRLRGFGDMGIREIARRTGLRATEVSRAKEREFDEPFVAARPLSADEEAHLERMAEDLGLRVTRGGRFHHLIGPSSKGAAVRLLVSAYRSGGATVRTLALGDGPNDLEMLEAVDRPVIVARPDGRHHPRLREALPGARLARGIGPEGFAEAVLAYLARPW